MNVIFLDIDGVMNSHIFYKKRHNSLKYRLRSIYWRFIAMIKFIFNGFKRKAVSLADWKPNPKHSTFKHQFGRLVEETDKEKWKWLSEFCNEHDYKICISSVWRRHFTNTLLDWNNALLNLGFKEGTFVGTTETHKTLRGTEIKDWVDKYQYAERNPIKYVILDDDSDMLPEQLHTCYFQVDPWFGLTPNHLYRINRFFNNK